MEVSTCVLSLELENLRQGESYDSTDWRVDGLGKNPAGETGEGTGRGGLVEAKGTEEGPPERSPEDTGEKCRGHKGAEHDRPESSEPPRRVTQAKMPAPPLAGCVTFRKKLA